MREATDRIEMKPVSLLDGPLTFAGAVSLEVDGAVHPWRIPYGQRDLFDPGLVERAACPAGVRLRLSSDAEALTLRVVSPEAEPSSSWVFDLLVDGRLHQRVHPPVDARAIEFTDLPAGRHLLELYLPSQYVSVPIRSLEVNREATVEPWPDERPRWITHGSSITHCRHAHGPSETWPALVANRLGLNLTCLGYGGSCHAEPMVARMIRDLPADYISLKLGANVVGEGSLSKRTFRAAIIGMIETIRDGHLHVPIAVVSPFFWPEHEVIPNGMDMTMPLAREVVEEAVRTLQKHGDRNLRYVDGLTIFGREDEEYLADKVHPGGDGQHIIADRFSALAMPESTNMTIAERS